jgi:hypothetical protein
MKQSTLLDGSQAGHQHIHRTHIEKPTPALADGGEVVGTRVGIAPDLMP